MKNTGCALVCGPIMLFEGKDCNDALVIDGVNQVTYETGVQSWDESLVIDGVNQVTYVTGVQSWDESPIPGY